MNPININSSQELGQFMRLIRRSQGVRQDDLANAAGTSHVFLRSLEQGRAHQVERMFAMMQDLGIALYVEPPPSMQQDGK